MDDNVLRRLESQLRRGEVIAFTGAGFSLAAFNSAGRPMAGVAELRQRLWPLAFPGSEPDEESTLGEIYDCASRQAGNAVGAVMRELFTVDSASLADVYGLWFSMPWHRLYTVNVDDLDEAAARRFDLPRNIRSLSAIDEAGLPRNMDELLCVHLNGRCPTTRG